MCFTKNASIYSFVICQSVSIILFIKGLYFYKPELKVLALFFSFVGFMQLYDYLFWSYPVGTSMNYVVTKIAMLTNHLQPIVLALLIWLFMGKLGTSSKILTFIYIVCMILYSMTAWNQISYTGVTKFSKPSLYWEWNGLLGFSYFYPLFLVFLVWLQFDNFSSPLKYISVFVTLFIFFFSFFKYAIFSSTGRMWCYFASLVPIIYLLL